MAAHLSMPILIVDDYDTTVRIVRNLLRCLGFSHIDEASNGATALSKLERKNYALVISDSGLLHHLRADTRHAATLLVTVAEALSAQSLRAKLEGVLGAF